MKVAFMHVGEDPKHALKMLDSVRYYMDCEILHLSNQETPEIAGTTTVRMSQGEMGMTVFKLHLLESLTGDVLVLDTDVKVQADLGPVFGLPFDVALTWRDGPIMTEDGYDAAKLMPWNTGVVFTRTREFWRACQAWPEGKDIGWYSDQVAVAAVAPDFNVLRLHCENFNYTPKHREENTSKRLVVHYKGKRKDWM